MKRITTLIALMMAAFVGWSQDFSAVCSTGQTLFYTITSSTAPYTVTVDAPENGYGSDMTGALSIPATVSYQGVDYTVTAIGISAFYRCRDITEVTFPNTAKSIGEYSFYQCSGITSIALPNALDSIYGHAFYKCTSLTELTIPNTVTYIGNYAFAHCTSILGNLIIPNTVTTLGESAFFHCSGITGLTLSNAITTIEDHLFTDCTSLVGTLNIPEGVTSIGVEAFYGCSSITRVQLPSTLTYIHTGAFESCAAMTGTLSIPDAVTDIDEMAAALSVSTSQPMSPPLNALPLPNVNGSPGLHSPVPLPLLVTPSSHNVINSMALPATLPPLPNWETWYLTKSIPAFKSSYLASVSKPTEPTPTGVFSPTMVKCSEPL